MNSFKKLGRLCRTIRPLKFLQIRDQIVLRLKRKLLPRLLYPKIKHIPFEGFREIKAPPIPCPHGEATGVDLLTGTFKFINQEKELGWPPMWQPSGVEKLWIYNLHYFEWLWGLDYEQSKIVVVDWINNYPFSLAHDGWEPYPLSLRLQNWCVRFGLEFSEELKKDKSFSEKLWRSITTQCEWLSRNLETHILANHYLENGLALYAAGSLFYGDSAQRWEEKGRLILFEQIEEQMLEDGMHFERSPMYHLRLCNALLLALTVTENDEDKNRLRIYASKAVAALKSLLHPDGDVCLFNDSATDIYLDPTDIFNWAEELVVRKTVSDIEKRRIFASGLCVWGDGSGNHLFIDVGIIGPDYQSGHAHADTLSFELSLKGHRVFVDTGVSGYVVGSDRTHDRSTKSHNTVVISGENQSEVWGSFRVGRRATPIVHGFQSAHDGFFLDASHDGYRFLANSPIHRRTFSWKDGSLTIVDLVENRGDHSVQSYWHFDPACTVNISSENEFRVSGPFGETLFVIEGVCIATIEENTICRRFGIKEPSKCLAVEHFEDEVSFQLHSNCKTSILGLRHSQEQ